MAYIGKTPIVGNFQKCDAITVVNGQAAYTLQVSSTNVVPESANHMLVSLNGILQAPVTSFSVSGSTLTFVSNLATGDVIDFVILLGNVLDLGTPSDGTVTNAKLAQDIISGETALTSAPAATDELLLSDAGTLKRIDYSLITNTPAFQAYASADANGTYATWTKIAFNTELFDTDSCYDHSSNYRFTPDVSGKYFVYTNIRVGSTTANVIDDAQISIYKNGSAFKSANIKSTSTGAELDIASLTVTSIIDFNGSSDYVEAYYYVDTGGGQNQKIYGGQAWSSFGAYKITGV
jgi:hypothetical protein